MLTNWRQNSGRSVGGVARRGFSLIELLVVIIVIGIVAGIAIPVVGRFMRGRGLEDAGELIQTACTKARSQAIKTRDKQYVLLYTDYRKKGQAIQMSVTRSNGTNKSFTKGYGWIQLVDSNQREGDPNKELKSDGEQFQLPKNTEFDPTLLKNIVLTFYSDGSMIRLNDPDRSSGSLKQQLGFYDSLLGNESAWKSKFDLSIKHLDKGQVCWIDFVQNTGTVNFVVYPR